MKPVRVAETTSIYLYIFCSWECMAPVLYAVCSIDWLWHRSWLLPGRHSACGSCRGLG